MQTQISGFRLSPQQRRQWLLLQSGAAYRAQCVIALEGELRAEALREALQRVVARHEILRTTFPRTPGILMPIQVIADADAGAFAWSLLDLSGLKADERQAGLDQFLETQRRLDFDFERGPLLQASLVRLDARGHLLAVTLPALCADARTLKNFFEQLGASYAALLYA